MNSTKERENNESRSIMASPGKLYAAAAVLLVLVLITGMLLARYVSSRNAENEMSAAGFHFSSSALQETSEDTPVIQNGVFTVDIRNYEIGNTANISGMKSNGKKTGFDIRYRITAVNTDTNTAVAGGKISVSSDKTGITNPLSANEGAYTLEADGETKIIHTVTIDSGAVSKIGGYGNTASAALNAAKTDIHVKAESISPYKKTFERDVEVVGIAVTKEAMGGNISRLVIMTNQYEGPLTLTWTKDTFPAALVNENDYGWSVQYTGSGNSARRATITVKRNTTYYFEYNESAGAPAPTFGGTWQAAVIDSGV